MPSKQYYVYIISNFRRTVLYTGITDNLVKRVWQHKNNLAKGFSQRYYLHNLLYDELIVKFNPKLKDLYDDIRK